MSFIKIKQKGETSDKFQELIISNAPQLKDVPVGNIAVSGPSGEIVDSGVNAAQLQENVNTLAEEVEETKKSVASGKELLATSISGKKIPTNASDSFATMASNIDSISTSGPYVWARYEYEKHKAGLYDVNNNLIADWDTLVNTYGIDIENNHAINVDGPTIGSPGYILINNPELAPGVKLVISSSVMKIGKHAFSFCEVLQSVIIPESITEIGEYAFYNCTNLTSVTIPASVIRIDYNAFRNCTSLISVYFMHMGDIGPGVLDRAFYKTSGDITTFYFKNNNVREGFWVNFGSQYNDSFAIISEDYSWTAPEVDIKAEKIFLDYILSSDEFDYPDGELYEDGYWYQRYYDHGINIWKRYSVVDSNKGEFIDYIVAKDSNEYPENGAYLENWYELLLSEEIVDPSAASANQIFNGKVAIVNGGKVTGTALATTTTATAANIMSGLTAYDNNGNLITGTKHFKTGTVTATSATSLSISGLGFTPKYIILTAEGNISNSQDSYRRVHFLNNASGTVWGGYSGYSSYSYGYYSTYMASGVFTITFGNGTVSLSNSSSYYFAATTYRYTVWD